MKKILYFVQLPPPVHGVSTMNKYITQSKYINQGFEKHILPIKFSSTIKELRKWKFMKILIGIILFFRLMQKIKKIQPDIVYFSIIPVGIGFLRDLIFVLTIKITGVAPIYHLNNRGITYYAEKKIWRKLYEFAFNNANIIHVSEGLLKCEIDILNLKNTRTFVVGNTIKPFKINSSKKLGNRINVLFFSNYLPEKGLLVLLEAITLLKIGNYNVFLNVHGSSFSKREDAKIHEFIEENDLDEYVQINGPVFDEEKFQIFTNADIFVFPSYFSEECCPLSILEAMYAGLPIIATNIGAIPEMIEDGKEGLLVEPKNEIQISEKVIQLINNPDLRMELGRNAVKKFEEKYAYQIFEKKMKQILNRIVNDQSGT